MLEAKVTVMPKASVLDPQGVAVQRAMQSHGMECVAEARVGKVIELRIEGDDLEATRARLDEICQDLLSNPVIEDYTLELTTSSRETA